MRFATRVMMLLSVVSLLTLPQAAFGQAVYGSIFGTVTDATGAIVPGATITVTDESKGTSVTVQSNGTGDFTVEHLIPDVYDVKVDANGFKGYEQKGVQLSADSAVKVVAALAVGGSTEVVEVNADCGSTIEDGSRRRCSQTSIRKSWRTFRFPATTLPICSCCCRARCNSDGLTLLMRTRRAPNRSRSMDRRSAV